MVEVPLSATRGKGGKTQSQGGCMTVQRGLLKDLGKNGSAQATKKDSSVEKCHMPWW